jgi:hypothetical protein
LVYIFKLGERIMGLVHPNGILASSAEGSTEFRLASAMQLKKKGVRYLGGKFNSSDTIECVRTGTKVPALDIDGILTVKTDGVASELEDCMEFHQLVKDIDSGLTSPLIDVTRFIKASSKLDSLRLSVYLNTTGPQVVEEPKPTDSITPLYLIVSEFPEEVSFKAVNVDQPEPAEFQYCPVSVETQVAPVPIWKSQWSIGFLEPI